RGVEKFFHPHPFTVEAARERAFYSGNDQYFVLLEGGEVQGYGMLRGWDEGYEIPSVGIVIHPDVEGQGFGRLLMDFLRVAAVRSGAKKILVRVHSENRVAVDLYRSLGYEFASQKDASSLVGFLDVECR